MRPDKVLVFLDEHFETTTMPLTSINSFWLRGIGYDIIIGEDARGDPYIIIRINRIGTHMKLQEIDNSSKGKAIKVLGTGSSEDRKLWRALVRASRASLSKRTSQHTFGGISQEAADNTGQTHRRRKSDLEDLACAR